jgi:alpha-tubulin suppressor-like RCC1 family protein
MPRAVTCPAGKARLPDGIICVQVVAGDGFTFALTDQGSIYGWGQFKDDLSSFYSFSAGVKVQRLPALVYQPVVSQLEL